MVDSSRTRNFSPVAVEPEPAGLDKIFGDRLELARCYTADLARRGEELGLIGPVELPRLWSRHIMNCATLVPLISPGRIGDIGSGAGLPGLVLAIAVPRSHFVLIEPMERRVDWLRSEINELGLTNVTVIRARAEETRLEDSLDQVTARAVTALSKLIPATARLVRPGGQMVFLKGSKVDEEVRAARTAIHRHSLSDIEILLVGEGITPDLTRVFRATVN
ncbi:MAG: 16S rRNA (guanine(527)-N(7))-methyltransferase RsmG [Rhodoglobus sp.]